MTRFFFQLLVVLALLMVSLCADNATTPAATTPSPTTPAVTTQKPPAQNLFDDIRHVIFDLPEAVARLCKDKVTAVYELFHDLV